MDISATVGGDDPSIAELLEVLRAERAELEVMEAAARECPLPAGWRWEARLRVAVTRGAWLFRASIAPVRDGTPTDDESWSAAG